MKERELQMQGKAGHEMLEKAAIADGWRAKAHEAILIPSFLSDGHLDGIFL